MEKPEKIPCRGIFSNGTEYELFLSSQCYKCTRFRKGRCRIYNRIEEARWVGEKVFPFDDLMDWSGGFGGKTCKSFTTLPIERKPRQIKPVVGQIEMEDNNHE